MKKLFPSIFAIDFEGSKKSGVVEFGVVELAPDGTIGFFRTSLCAPKKPLSERESLITGIDTSEASCESPFDSHIEFFAKLRSKGAFAAHNAATEDAFLRSYAPVLGCVPNFFSGGACNTWGPWVDSLVLARFAGVDNPKLSAAAQYFQIECELEDVSMRICPGGRRKWHCALYDAIASALIIKKILSLPEFGGISFSSFGARCGVKDSGQTSFI